MDPFGRLPWFVLQNTLSNLPDLPSLHSLHDASPEVAAFLHRNNDIFAQIVDAIIGDPVRGERGLVPHVQDTVRLVILVWSRQKATGLTQEPGTDIHGSLQYVRERSPLEAQPMLKAISPSTPSAILCQLLSLMARLRCLTHACFHSMIARCLKLQVEHLPKKMRYYNNHLTRPILDRSRRPQGIPYTPVDIGPPTWIEEQRLLSSLLCIVLFYELRKSYFECSVITEDRESVWVLLDDNVEGFWNTILRKYNDGQVEQIATILHWMDDQAGGHENIYSWLLSGGISEDYSHCCQHYTSVTDDQWAEAENNVNSGRSSRGMKCLWRCKSHLLSPLKCLDYSVFRSYGLVFWDGIRMDALGFPGTQNVQEMWFAWSSILTEQDWEEMLRRQSSIATAN
ncbi:hypothetical protein ETB97_006281 [Aspergillus alliaceus]|uniref:Uncharacterized protein n=1 Tax=Petromyces alliaceus TaxID=209559 RepID=A0A8H6E2L3_PETAA|nr:hypothetical protein ETB97_006281 [Aspergillus burnettii]